MHKFGLTLAVVAVALGAQVALAKTVVEKPRGRMSPVSPSAELRREMDRYGFSAYKYTDGTDTYQFLMYVAKSGGRNLPLVVYIPGSGERGDLIRQFRQRALFDRVTAADFQKAHPCCLMAISPPESMTTLVGGLPGEPNPQQKLMREMIFEAARRTGRVDPNRVYLTGFSYGGSGVYYLALTSPGTFAATVPVASIPPLPEYFSPEHPGNWWHFYNEGDYARKEMPTEGIYRFRDRTNAAGGDFRIGTYPGESHDAWTATWAEDGLWDWMFEKTLAKPSARGKAFVKKGNDVPIRLNGAKCTASVAGKDAGSGPERVIDGLDETSYEPERGFKKTDWWMVELASPVAGRVKLFSGDKSGLGRLKDAVVEVSEDGRRWTVVGQFSPKDGVCSFARNAKFRFVRVRSTAPTSRLFILRRLSVYAS